MKMDTFVAEVIYVLFECFEDLGFDMNVVCQPSQWIVVFTLMDLGNSNLLYYFYVTCR